MSQLFDKRLDVEGDERLILDNQHRRTDLFGNLASGAVDKVNRLGFRAIKRLGDLPRTEGLDRVQKESDPWLNRDGGEISVCRGFIAEGRIVDLMVGRHVAPVAQE